MTQSSTKKRIQIGGVWFDALTFSEALEAVIGLSQKRERPLPYVVTPNVDHVVRLGKTPELHQLYHDAALSLADGMPVVWASHIKGAPLPERVTGADLMPALCAKSAELSLKVFLMGGPPGAAVQAAESLTLKWPKLRIETHCPPFGFEKNADENEIIINKVNQFDPHILFVGLGSPKQELWIAKNRDRLMAGVALGVGAAIEFEAGMLPRAPIWMQKSGTEWIFRMVNDPKRLTKRYLGNVVFLRVFLDELKNRQQADQKGPENSKKVV